MFRPLKLPLEMIGYFFIIVISDPERSADPPMSWGSISARALKTTLEELRVAKGLLISTRESCSSRSLGSLFSTMCINVLYNSGCASDHVRNISFHFCSKLTPLVH